jgi:D-xylose transport system substrate-binding protein
MTVYKSLRKLANESAKMTVALVKGEKLPLPTVKVEGVDTMQLDPIVITKANMDLLVKDQFYTKEQLGM